MAEREYGYRRKSKSMLKVLSTMNNNSDQFKTSIDTLISCSNIDSHQE
jgi:hypothetical protein